ncbi:MAG TPA: right-handed parallel beta-helix repeat-containing protein [Bryobacteraceae bacterium]|nr:right-handed parallel beta-helix repeat-containing protein [Bryobacteraceae bacterium]
MRCLLILGLFAAGAAGAEFYVAPNGSDSAPGTQSRPFATLERARDAIRAMKRQGGLPAGGVTVWLGAGRYQLSASFALSAEDSGTERARIVYRARPGEEVRLTGGRPVTGFQHVQDPAARERIHPLYRNRVLAVDLRAQGITDFGRLLPRGFGQSAPAALELFFNDQPMTLARWPNQGFVHVGGLPAGEAAKITDIHAAGSKGGRFVYREDRPERWSKALDIWLHGYWRYDWADNYVAVRSIDPAVHQIATDGSPGPYGIAPGQRYYYLNLLEELDEPGEWYLDRRTGMLYFWPPATPEGKSTWVSLLEKPLVSLDDVSDVTVAGLIVEQGRGNGVEIRGGARDLVAGCTLRNLGNYAVVIQGGSRHGVLSNDIYATGDGGIQLHGGDRRTLTPAGHYARNNHIHDFDRWSRTYCPAVLVTGVGNEVSHNLIHDSPHNAIQISGNDHVIEFNEIHHVAEETGDVGAVYLGRNWTERGNVVRHNFFHHIGAPGRDVRVVYLDDCASGTTVFGNLFYETTRGVIIGGGRDNRVENNVFVNSEPGVRIDDRCVSTREVWRNMVYKEMQAGLDAVRESEALYRRRYPALGGIEPYYAAKGGVPPEGNSIAHNISLGATWLSFALEQPADRKLFDVRENLVDQVIPFADPTRMNFSIPAGSPVYQTGFQPIPVDRIGLFVDEYRKGLPR